MKLKRIIQAMVLALASISISAFATGQIADTFIFQGNEYSLIGQTKGDFATPKQFGMTPTWISTACGRGFYATYELTKTNFFIRELTLREKDENYLPINGVEADTESEEYQGTYTNLNVQVKFTGKVRLAKDFLQDLYFQTCVMQGGIPSPIFFNTVLDVTLKEGRVVDIKNRSKEMETKRNEHKKLSVADKTKEAFAIENEFSYNIELK